MFIGFMIFKISYDFAVLAVGPTAMMIQDTKGCNIADSGREFCP